jgi:hypothetical protein
MGYKVNRNDPCPCGSGKKYKKCCMKMATTSIGKVTTIDFKWHQLRSLEGRMVDQHLFPYATEELPEDVINLALADFSLKDYPEALDKDLFFHQFFLPWFLFNWISFEDFGLASFDPEQTLAQNYLQFHKSQLNSHEIRFIETINHSHYSYYSILEVEEEKSLLVKDILLGTTHTIKEKQGTRSLKRGDLVFGRILTLDDQSIFVGMAPISIPARYQHDLIDFKTWLLKENNEVDLTPKDLREIFEEELFEYFFSMMVTLFNRPLPTLMNTDGELLQLSKSYFRLKLPATEALKLLLPLSLEKTPSKFLHGAKKDKAGNIKQIKFPWLKKSNKMHKYWKTTIMGDITLELNRLILETNSQERTLRGKKLLSKYLGESILFQRTLIENPQQQMKTAPFNAKSKVNTILPEELLPEVQEQLHIMAQEHWKNWFNVEIPALKNQTPREAAKTKEGRERLEALLLEYESNDLQKKDNLFKADIPYLRKELGLESQIKTAM